MRFYELNCLNSARDFSPKGHEIAGDEAEKVISKQIKSATNGLSFIYNGKRVPRPDSAGRYEIDIILLTRQHLYVLEVKSYSGSLSKVGSNWIQTRRNGEQVEHEDNLYKNQLKLEALNHYLRNFKIPDGYIQQRVLFYKDLILSPEIARDPRVVTHDQIKSFVPKVSLFKRVEDQFFAALIHFLVSEEEKQSARESVMTKRINSDVCRSIGEKIDMLRTWDEICLKGGRIIRGDAYCLYIEGKEYEIRNIEASTGFSCKWTRNKLFGFIKSLRGKPLGFVNSKHRKHELTPSKDKIKMHRVGRPKPEYIYLREVEWFCKG
jgi:Nuclease-related domain.